MKHEIKLRVVYYDKKLLYDSTGKLESTNKIVDLSWERDAIDYISNSHQLGVTFIEIVECESKETASRLKALIAEKGINLIETKAAVEVKETEETKEKKQKDTKLI